MGSEKIFHIGRFTTGLPPFSKKKSADNKWSLQKEGLQGRQITDGLKVYDLSPGLFTILMVSHS